VPKKAKLFETFKVNDGREDLAGIRITEGEFKGVEFQFTRVSIDDHQQPDGDYLLHFDYGILHTPNALTEESIPKLEEDMAGILMGIVEFTVAQSELEEAQKQES